MFYWVYLDPQGVVRPSAPRHGISPTGCSIVVNF